ncbi:MAG: isopentenyl-diphosphate Delta-isomerase [Gemmatimonadetes bacterium]|nr:isopentenyl-diphosphate Delta-isomerase [Gemmatimonadota bacterium]
MSTVEEQVVLVDEGDREIGTSGKLEAHRAGRLHRAFSVFVFDMRGNLLLQRRADGKYHSAGLWSNTCCGHPRPGEDTLAAAHRRLAEEMGFDCPLTHRFAFTYRADLDQGLVEHELDHVFDGRYADPPEPDPAEVDEWRRAPVPALLKDLELNPQRYSAWLKGALHGLRERNALPAA